MLQQPISSVLTRRHILIRALTLAGIGFASRFRVHAAGADFWNRKDPAAWSSEEIEKLMTRSPWAREVQGESLKTGTRGMVKPGGIGNKSGRTPSPKRIAPYKGTVLWESAKPIRDALRTALPDEFAGHYVLSVNGIPLIESKSPDDGAATASGGTLDNLKGLTALYSQGAHLQGAHLQGAHLQGKGPIRHSIRPGLVQQQTGNGAVFLFGFPKEELPLTRDDKEVVFETHLDTLVFTAKFALKEMLYHNELAV